MQKTKKHSKEKSSKFNPRAQNKRGSVKSAPNYSNRHQYRLHDGSDSIGSSDSEPTSENSSSRQDIDNHIRKIAVKKIALFHRKIDEKSLALEILPPNNWTKSLSKKTILFLKSNTINIEFINPSHDEGILIEFYFKTIYFLIEIFNDKDIVILKRYADNSREVYDLKEETYFETLKTLLPK